MLCPRKIMLIIIIPKTLIWCQSGFQSLKLLKGNFNWNRQEFVYPPSVANPPLLHPVGRDIACLLDGEKSTDQPSPISFHVFWLIVFTLHRLFQSVLSCAVQCFLARNIYTAQCFSRVYFHCAVCLHCDVFSSLSSLHCAVFWNLCFYVNFLFFF